MSVLYPDASGHRGMETSVAAAVALSPSLGRLQHMVLDVIRAAGMRGLTADELAASLGMSCWSIQPRISELKREGLIRDSHQRRLNVTGKEAIVWVAILPGGSS